MKNKFDRFIKSHKEQYNDSLATFLTKGKLITLYKNQYEVVKCDDKYTILKDEKGHPIAYRTERMRQILGLEGLNKANPGTGPAPCESGKVRVYRTDSSGKKYSYCVNPDTGQRAEGETGEIPKQIKAEEQKQRLKARNFLAEQLGENYSPELAEKIDKHLEMTNNFKNLMAIQNNLLDEGASIPTATHDKIARLNGLIKERRNEIVQEIKNAIRESKNQT